MKKAESVELGKEWLAANPEATICYVTTDGNVFKQKNKGDAYTHAKREKLDVVEVSEYTNPDGLEEDENEINNEFNPLADGVETEKELPSNLEDLMTVLVKSTTSLNEDQARLIVQNSIEAQKEKLLAKENENQTNEVVENEDKTTKEPVSEEPEIKTNEVLENKDEVPPVPKPETTQAPKVTKAPVPKATGKGKTTKTKTEAKA